MLMKIPRLRQYYTCHDADHQQQEDLELEFKDWDGREIRASMLISAYENHEREQVHAKYDSDICSKK